MTREIVLEISDRHESYATSNGQPKLLQLKRSTKLHINHTTSSIKLSIIENIFRKDCDIAKDRMKIKIA